MKTVTEYIENAPKEMQAKLKQLREIIQTTAPTALEKLSYGMPYYGLQGRLAYFSYAKNHIGLYIPPPVIAEHSQELARYSVATATVRFRLTKPLPVSLIKKLIKARMTKIQEKIKA